MLGRDQEVDVLTLDLDHRPGVGLAVCRLDPLERRHECLWVDRVDEVAHGHVADLSRPVGGQHLGVGHEAVDDDFERALPGVQLVAVVAAHPGHRVLRLEPQVGEPLEQAGEQAERVAPGLDAVVEHHRRIQALDVGVDDGPDDAGHEHVGVPADDLAADVGAGERVAGVEVAPHEQALDLGRRAGPRGLAVRHRHHLRQVERAAGQVPRQPLGLGRVVDGVLHQPVRVGVPDLGDLVARHVGPALRREAEVFGGPLQRVVREVPPNHVERHHLVERVDDVAPGDLDGVELDLALGEPHRGRVGPRRAPVAAEVDRDPVPPAPLEQVGKVEPRDVVPFDHVWVPLLDEGHRLAQDLLLGHVRRADEPAPPGRVAERDQDHAVVGLGRLGEPVPAVDLDVELEADEVLEGHPLEQRPPGLHEVLLLGRAGQVDLVGPRLLGLGLALDVAERVEVAPAVREGHDVPEEAGARQLLELEPVAREAPQEVGVGEEEERVDADVLGPDLGRRAAAVQPHRGRADRVERDDPLGRVVAVEEGIVREVNVGHLGQSTPNRRRRSVTAGRSPGRAHAPVPTPCSPSGRSAPRSGSCPPSRGTVRAPIERSDGRPDRGSARRCRSHVSACARCGRVTAGAPAAGRPSRGTPAGAARGRRRARPRPPTR